MTTVLVDTSVWRGYFSGRASAQAARRLDDLLDEDGAVFVHPAVVGELTLGGLALAEERLLQRLPTAPEVSSAELQAFIRYRKLPRRGIGWIDCHLLASSLVISSLLWSFDRTLAAAAMDLRVAFTP